MRVLYFPFMLQELGPASYAGSGATKVATAELVSW